MRGGRGCWGQGGGTEASACRAGRGGAGGMGWGGGLPVPCAWRRQRRQQPWPSRRPPLLRCPRRRWQPGWRLSPPARPPQPSWQLGRLQGWQAAGAVEGAQGVRQRLARNRGSSNGGWPRRQQRQQEPRSEARGGSGSSSSDGSGSGERGGTLECAGLLHGAHADAPHGTHVNALHGALQGTC